MVEVELGFYVKKEEKVRLARINALEPGCCDATFPYYLLKIGATSSRAKPWK